MDDDNFRMSISSQRENHILTRHTIKKPNFFEIDEILDDYITNNSKK